MPDAAPPHTLDHLKPGHAPLPPGPEERSHDRMLRVRMDARARIAEIKRGPEERRTSRLLERLRGPP